MKNNIVTKLLNLLETKGSNIQYGNENVTQLEHALQCAELAEKNNFSKEIITAALLHDIGHLLYDGEDPINEGKDGYHENGYKNGDPKNPICIDNCLREDGSAYCKNQGTCLKVKIFQCNLQMQNS